MPEVTAAATPRRRVHEYETIYILKPSTEPAEGEKVSERVTEVISRLGARLVKVDNWGKRRLAYPIKHQSRGIFVYIRYVGFNDVVAELERNLRLLDVVVRFQTVRVQPDVDPAAYQIDPEEVKFLPVEVTVEEEEEGIEERLGFRTTARAPEESPHDDEDDIDLDAVIPPGVTEEEEPS
jgi:small subunit ribosomal protein S6